MGTADLTLDSCFICSLVNKSDVNHEQAFLQYKKYFENAYVFIPQIVLLEFAILKRAKYDNLHQTILKFFEIIKYEIFIISSKTIQEFEKFIEETDYNLKPNDYFILFVSKITNSKLLTFDEKLNSF